MMGELNRVIRYPRVLKLYKMTEEEILEYVRVIELIARFVEPGVGLRIVGGDEADDPVVRTAMAGESEVICTLDKHFHTPDVLSFCSGRGIRVMSDIDLLHFLRTQP
jgi:hypothetical protein